MWTDGSHNGFIRLEIDHDGARAEYVKVTNILTRDYDTEIVYTANIASENGSSCATSSNWGQSRFFQKLTLTPKPETRKTGSESAFFQFVL